MAAEDPHGKWLRGAESFLVSESPPLVWPWPSESFQGQRRNVLSYCCLVRSLRDEHYVRRGLPAIIVVAIADGMAGADVGDAMATMKSSTSPKVAGLVHGQTLAMPNLRMLYASRAFSLSQKASKLFRRPSWLRPTPSY